MAEQGGQKDRDDLSEEISQFRLQEFRRQGRVFQSREITGALGLAVTGASLFALLPDMVSHISNFMREVFDVARFSKMEIGTLDAAKTIGFKSVGVLAMASLPVLLVAFFASIVGSFIQTGSVFSTDPLTPDFGKINPMSGLQRLLSLKQVWEGIRVIAKTAALILVGWLILKAEVLRSPGLLLSELGAIPEVVGGSGKALLYSLLAVMGIFAGVDFWLQRSEYRKHLRLTRQEAKEEHKEHEGDPLLKARVRTVQRDMARKRMMESVKKADVIITNPTHIAVAIRYDRENMAAPIVLAKGADFLAQRIKQIAVEAGVPLVENQPLARTLFKAVKVGKAIPKNLYKAVAEVLAFVYRLKGRV